MKRKCIFCGDEGAKVEFQYDQYNDDGEIEETYYAVECLKCGAKGPDCTSPAEAEGKWENRSIS